MGCNLPGSSARGILQARILGVGYHFLLQGIFPTGGSNPRLLFGRWIRYCWATIQPPALGTWSLSRWTTREVPACTILIPWLGLISLQCNGLSRIFSNITVQKHHFREWDVAFYWLGLSTFTAEGSMPSQGQKQINIFHMFYLLLCCTACRILIPWQGREPIPLQWKCRALTTGPPGKSQFSSLAEYSVPPCVWASQVAFGKNHLPMKETQRGVWSLGQADPLEEEMATHSSILAWRIPWTKEPGGMQSIGSKRVWHDWATEHTHTMCKIYMYLLVCCMLSHLRHTWLYAPMDCSPPGSSVHEILQARIRVARSSFRGSSQSRDQTCVSCISCFGRQVLYCWRHLGSPVFACSIYIYSGN